MYKTFRILYIQQVNGLEPIVASGFMKSPNIIGTVFLLNNDKLILPCHARLEEKEEKLVANLFHKGLKKLCNQ